jgi:hypothetical protein
VETCVNARSGRTLIFALSASVRAFSGSLARDTQERRDASFRDSKDLICHMRIIEGKESFLVCIGQGRVSQMNGKENSLSSIGNEWMSPFFF